LLVDYSPKVLVLHNLAVRKNRRTPKARRLTKRIVDLAGRFGVETALFTRDEIRQAFFEDGEGTKFTIANVIARRYADELGSKLPRKRKAWMPEHPNMDIFDAVALVMTFQM
jgi:hypothetical protein